MGRLPAVESSSPAVSVDQIQRRMGFGVWIRLSARENRLSPAAVPE